MGFVIIYLGKAKGVCIAWLPFFFPETPTERAVASTENSWSKRPAQSAQG